MDTFLETIDNFNVSTLMYGIRLYMDKIGIDISDMVIGEQWDNDKILNKFRSMGLQIFERLESGEVTWLIYKDGKEIDRV